MKTKRRAGAPLPSGPPDQHTRTSTAHIRRLHGASDHFITVPLSWTWLTLTSRSASLTWLTESYPLVVAWSPHAGDSPEREGRLFPGRILRLGHATKKQDYMRCIFSCLAFASSSFILSIRACPASWRAGSEPGGALYIFFWCARDSPSVLYKVFLAAGESLM